MEMHPLEEWISAAVQFSWVSWSQGSEAYPKQRAVPTNKLSI